MSASASRDKTIKAAAPRSGYPLATWRALRDEFPHTDSARKRYTIEVAIRTQICLNGSCALK
jgi:hypothetical protein